MNPRFLIGSSYCEHGRFGPDFRRQFARIWSERIGKADLSPSKVVIISTSGDFRPEIPDGFTVIRMDGDLGGPGELIHGKKDNELGAWSATMLTTAMLAYVNECDFVYVEEDCLAFGPWVKQLYTDLGDGGIAFGYKQLTDPYMPATGALFIVRRNFIPTFVSSYIEVGDDRDFNRLPEHRFCSIEEKFGGAIARRLSFGVDRERPIPWDNPVWYAQQISLEELEEFRRRNLVSN